MDLDTLLVGITCGAFMAGPIGWIFGRHGTGIDSWFGPEFDSPEDSPKMFSMVPTPGAKGQPSFLGPDGRRYPMERYKEIQALNQAQLDAQALERTT